MHTTVHTHSVWERCSIHHDSYGWGTVTSRTLRYATVEIGSWRKVLPVDELTHDPDCSAQHTTGGLADHTRQAIARMRADRGREIPRPGGGTWWVNTHTGVTLNCLHDPDHTGTAASCSGWIAPHLGGAKPCYCPCHDEHRPDYNDARKLVEEAAEANRRRAEAKWKQALLQGKAEQRR